MNIFIFEVCGEAASVSQNDCDKWLKKVLPWLTEEFTDGQIGHADKTGFFFKLTPEITLKFEGEKGVSGKLSKNRITVFVAWNMAILREICSLS